MRLTADSALPFDVLLPIYNWIYPLSGRRLEQPQSEVINRYRRVGRPAESRALYFHVPFCETICTFCPFVRGHYQGDAIIDRYVDALAAEIRLKGAIPSLTSVPIGALFFGGGTPSLLSPEQIRRLGREIRNNFDLSNVREFSFEFEVKSVSQALIEALRDIGVTHARFGLQTMNRKYRTLFNLTASLEQVYRAAQMLRASFPVVSCDVLYGMNGQTVDEFIDDIETVVELGLSNLDFYPINNVVTQVGLHNAYRAADARPTPGITKHYMNRLLRAALRDHGYLPHNGHGYVKASSPAQADAVLTREYSFVYHEHVYGYADWDLLGFGNNAISSFQGYTSANVASRDSYMRAIDRGELPATISEHDAGIDAAKPLALRLPYHGVIDTSKVAWDDVPPECLTAMDQLLLHGLIQRDGGSLTLTHEGWYWYSNIMFYLMPRSEQLALQRVVSRARSDPRRDIEDSWATYKPTIPA